jgi:glycosyltransferase involved in cell wall biosynthesis
MLLIKKEKNTGYIESLNMAIKISRGIFLARMDGDDISVSDRLAKQVEFLNNNPDVVVCGSWYQLLQSGETVSNPVENEDIRIALLDYCALGHPTIMMRKEFLVRYNLFYKPEYRPAEDYELWTRISTIGKVANVPEVLLYYRSHERQVSVCERTNQLDHSVLCRASMLCHPLPELTPADLKFAELIVEQERLKDVKLLAKVIDWLDGVNKANTSTFFFPIGKFDVYIHEKKAAFVRSFYLNTTPYNPPVLFQFMKAGSKFSSYFQRTERLKLALKCLLFWKAGLTNR